MTPEDRVISTNTFSKAWLMTGWRLGWLVVPPTLAADTSDSGVGSRPITLPVRVERSKAWTASVLAAEPPPKITRRSPITAPAASWNAWGTVPTRTTCPVLGSREKTPSADPPAASRPPAT